MGWKGYETALQHNPEGVKAVLRVAKDIPHTEGRALMSPSIELELAHIIERESGWRPDIQNVINGKPFATGLIQFTPQTAEQLGTTPLKLKAMSLQEQSVYVAKYFDMVLGAVGPAKKPGDLYIATFYPKVSHAPPEYVIAAKDSPGKWERLIWEQNPGLRCSPEGPITVACVRAYGTPSSEPPSGLPDLADPGPTVKARGSQGALGIMLVLFLAWMYKRGNLPLAA